MTEDCISRAEAINAISHAELSFQVESDLNFENYKREVQEIADGILKGQVKAINDLPSVQPIRPKGEWINTRPPERSDNIVCSLCGFDSIADYKFCPNCGAKMESEDKE